MLQEPLSRHRQQLGINTTYSLSAASSCNATFQVLTTQVKLAQLGNTENLLGKARDTTNLQRPWEGKMPDLSTNEKARETAAKAALEAAESSRNNRSEKCRHHP